MQLRDYQAKLKADIYGAWTAGHRNVCAALPTGGGKTVVFSSIIHEHQGASCAIAHRKELVSQIALALARENVKHRIIGPLSVVKSVVQDQMRELGTTLFDPNALCAVAGVNTLVNRGAELAAWRQQVTLWIQDEGHHVLKNNIWGTAASMFPNARGLGVTATPTRADGKGLGRHSDGLYDALVVGPQMRRLIEQGYLTDYKCFCPPNDLNLEAVPISDATGDYVQPKLKKAVRESKIIGDVVAHYQRLALGKLGVVFATDVETATDISRQFNLSNIRAEVVSAETDSVVRSEIVRRFRNRQIDILVNVDLFGEGFDLPAIEVISMARPTQSYGLYCQQFGRSLRPMPGKTHALIIDHVGNVIRHGLPDAARIWTLDGRDKKAKSDATDEIPLRPCPECTRPYEAFRVACPYCGYRPVAASRSNPEFVEGNLLELDAATLAQMRGAVQEIDGNGGLTVSQMQHVGAPEIAINGFLANHRRRQEGQGALRSSIAWWGGWQKQQQFTDAEIYRKFFLLFGVDMLTAQTLGRPDALALADRINSHMGRGCK